MVPLAGPIITFIAHRGLPPQYSHSCQTPWSVFQDGVKSTISSAPPTTRAAIKAVLRQPPTQSAPRAQTKGPQALSNMHASLTGDLRFPLSNFRHSLTLFSKFFSSFLHSTCSLSVSHPYLALDGIYHPLRAAIPSNSTPLHGLHTHQLGHRRDCHPL